MMKLIVLDENQEELLRQMISDYENAGHGYKSARDSYIAQALIEDICEQLEDNKVTPEDCEKMLDMGMDLTF